MQQRDGGPWEVCLEYAPAPGQNSIGWFVADKDHLRDDEPRLPGDDDRPT